MPLEEGRNQRVQSSYSYSKKKVPGVADDSRRQSDRNCEYGEVDFERRLEDETQKARSSLPNPLTH